MATKSKEVRRLEQEIHDLTNKLAASHTEGNKHFLDLAAMKTNVKSLRDDCLQLNQASARFAKAATGEEGRIRHSANCLVYGGMFDRLQAILKAAGEQ